MKLPSLFAGVCVVNVVYVIATPFLQPTEQPSKPRFNFKRMSDGGKSKHLRPVLERRAAPPEYPIGSSGPDTTVKGYFDGDGEYSKGQPIGEDGKGGIISGTLCAICHLRYFQHGDPNHFQVLRG